MSKIDDQITDLRKAAQVYRNLGKYAMEVVLLDAADTICELRGTLQVASVDYRQLATENAKLRELMADMLRYYAMPNDIDYKREADLLERAHEMVVDA